LSAAMLDFRLPVMSDNIVTRFFGMLDPENVGIAVGISLLSHMWAELRWG